MDKIINENGSGIFIQIGAGAGDLDKRANFKDGFTQFIKQLPMIKIKKIILVEPNPVNIPLLEECWNKYDQAVIYQIGICPKTWDKKLIDFYYCPLDGPHYQVASIKKEHILKHYGDNCPVESISIQVENIQSFLNCVSENDEIELLALDIEGIDAQIILDIDFENINIKYLSFEYIHMGTDLEIVEHYLNKNNFEYVGVGADHNGFDHLYKKIKI